MKTLFYTILFLLISNPLIAQNITDQWNGVLNVMGNQITLVFHIDENESGYTAEFDDRTNIFPYYTE